MLERLCVVMPIYNEEGAIGRVLVKWLSMLDSLNIDYRLCAYDDGSRDNSLQVMRTLASKFPRLAVFDKLNEGHGPTLLKGYRTAEKDGYDWIFQVDSDDEMGPESFPELWRIHGDYDFIVGRRDGRQQVISRKLLSFVSRLVVRLFYGCGRVWDVNSPYRLMRVKALKSVIDTIPPNTFAPNVIITGMVVHNHLRAIEINVPHRCRVTGVVSIKQWKVLKVAFKSLFQTVLYRFLHL